MKTPSGFPGTDTLSSMSMRKGYLARWKRRDKPEEHIVDYWFSFSPDNAACWDTRQEAENDCVIYSRFGIDILAENGGTYHCEKFFVEERKPEGFVVYCEAPFRSVDTPGKSTAEAGVSPSRKGKKERRD
jgi:hypothetical protein